MSNELILERTNSQSGKVGTWILIAFLAIICALGALGVGGYFYLQDQSQAVSCPNNDCTHQNQKFTISSGQGPAAIAQNLENAGLIKNRFAFRYQLRKMGLENKLRAGTFELSPAQTPQEIITALTVPPQEISITFLPGWRREEFANYLADLDLPNFDETEFLDKTKNLEGQLWADTYFIFPSASTDDIIKLLTSTFAKKVTTPYAAEIAASTYDLNQILTIASILQRESKTKDEMKMIAGVIENRLNIDMPLQFCATAQYASGYHPQEDSWWVEPTLDDTQIKSPYNTYVTPGLPPGPIAAPGLNAIEAALNPTDNEYFYYLHDPQGQIHYAKTGEQHNANKEQYLR